MRHARSYSVLLLLAAAAAGCQTGPTNGTTVAGSVIGKAFTFQGYYNVPSTPVSLQVMNDPSKDPAVDANWVQFATAVTGTSPQVDQSDPLYYWSVSAAPVPSAAFAARWPQGGLVRVRAVHTDANGQRLLNTFDDVTFGDCLSEQLQAGATWETIGIKCSGLGTGTAALVSTSNIPVVSGGFLSKKGSISTGQTNTYYGSIGAPGTLDGAGGFKATFGFPTNEVTATFYNDGDLGLGREMHCRATGGGGVACYVTNYSGVAGQAVFGTDPNTVLNDAVHRQNSFATVAMVYTGSPGTNAVRFMVYGPDGKLSPTAKLDSTGNNLSVPNNCLSCHGINSFFANGAVSGDAKFLPFDPFSYKFSTVGGFTFADQADAFRRLNVLVRSANATPAITELIDGMYAPKAVTDPTAVANNTFIPDAWKFANGSLAGTALYNGVVKVGCRTCHVSAVNPTYDFNSADDFSALISTIRPEVCGSNRVMPHAERVMKKFWESGARAYLVTGYGPAAYPDPLQACKP